MPVFLNCPHGHRWEYAVLSQASTTDGEVSCPVCGTVVDFAGAATAAGPTVSHPGPLIMPAGGPSAAESDPAATGPRLPGRDTAGQVYVPGYEILGELGRGGMGVVYQARQTALKRMVALKMILAGGLAGETERARFRTEAEAVARFQHPNIVQIHEVGVAEGWPFFSLEFCGGGSLAQKLAGTPLPAGEAAPLTETLARAVHYAHERGVVHRDLKPANILLASGGREHPEDLSASSGGSHAPLADYIPKVADFGLAKQLDEDSGQTRSKAVMGTPSYMAPEQALGGSKHVGPAADVYALGAILYECLTGRPPFKASSVLDTLEQVRRQEPVPPSRLQLKVPRELETVCLKCLEKEPARRYESALALAEDLRRFQAGEPIRARPVGVLERAGKWVRRNKAVAALLAAVAVLVIGGSAVGLWYLAERMQRGTELALRREYLNKEVGAAVAEAAHKRAALHKKLKDPRQVAELLSDIDQWDSRLQEARAAARRARILAEGGHDLLSEELAGQLRALKEGLADDAKDWALAKELDDVRVEASMLVGGKWDYRRAAKKYPQLFARAGLDVQKWGPGALPHRIARLPVRYALVAALDHWAEMTRDDKLRARLLEVAKQADPHPWRDRFRDVKVWGDRQQLQRLANELRPEDQSPQIIIALAQRLGWKSPDAMKVYRRALLHHGRDFWLYFNLANAIKDPAESIGYFEAALAVRPQNAAAHFNLGFALHIKNDEEGAITHFRKTIQIEPASFEAHNNLGNMFLYSKRDLQKAITHYRKAIQIDPNYTGAHNNLGLALKKKKDLDGAITSYRKAIQIDPNYADAHNNLAVALGAKKDVDGAVTHYRKAIQLDPNNAGPHINLADALRLQGLLAAALQEMKAGHALGSKQPGWNYPSEQLVKEYERLVARDQKLKAVLAGQAKPKDAAETLALADLCQRYKQQYAAAAQFYADAFAAEPQWAATLNGQRYSAACAAALASAGRGKDSAKLQAKEQPKLRRQALDWLRADLALWQRQAQSARPPEVLQVTEEISHWQTDPDLAGVRQDKELARLPQHEQAAWKKLWSDVEQLSRKVLARFPVVKHLERSLTGKERVHALEAKAGETYVLDLESKRFDTHLLVQDAQGKLLAANHNPAFDQFNSRLLFAPKQDGTYRVVATSWLQAGTGSYRLTIRRFAGKHGN